MARIDGQELDEADIDSLAAGYVAAEALVEARKIGKAFDEPIPFDDEDILTMARSDATFDGREWIAMGRTERERYLTRSRQAMSAVLELRVKRFAGLA